MALFDSVVFDSDVFDTTDTPSAFYSAFWGPGYWKKAFQVLHTGEGSQQIGGGGAVDYYAYRKKLLKIARAADKRLYSKVQKDIAKISESSAPDVVVEAAKEIERVIDFAALSKGESILMAQQLEKMLLKLDELMKQAIIRNEEDELILIMAII